MSKAKEKKEVTTNQGKKHLFGSSEKSDFILNMSAESAQKLCGVYSIIAVLVLCVITIPYYFTQNIKYGLDESTNRNLYLNEKFIFFISAAVLATGFVGFIIFLIANMKKQVELKDNKSLIVPLAVVLLSVVSCILSADVFTSFYGYLDRSEGMLTILGYWGLFAAGMTVTADSRRIKLADFIVGIGAFEAVVGLLQAIPATAKVVPNYFKELFSGFSKGGMTYTTEYVPTGFLCTPFALAAVLTVISAFALNGMLYDDKKPRKIFYGISLAVMTAADILTCVVPALVGLCSVYVVSLVIAAVRSGVSKNKKPVLICLAAAVVAVGIFAGLFASGEFRLLDEKIIFHDSFDRLSITGTGRGDDTDQWIYPYLWDDGMYTAEQNLIWGTGPDNWGTIFESGAIIDRSYNEYIDLLQSRGIIIFALTVVFLVITIVKMCKLIAGFMKDKNSWVGCAVSTAVLCYLIQAFFNISSVTSSPYFWLAAGLVWSFTAVKTSQKK